jgi:hypothetical protein
MNPQSWNRYAYVLNNPLRLVDPLGLACVVLNGDDTLSEIYPGDCRDDEGYFVDGTVTNTEFNEDGQLVRVEVDGNYLQQVGTAEGDLSIPQIAIVNSDPSWWGNFASSFFSRDMLKTAGHSFGEGGCNALMVETLRDDLSPLPTHGNFTPTEVGELAMKGASLGAYSQALKHAASATNVLGGTGLLYPMKSSIFRRLMTASKVAEEYAAPVAISVATIHSVYTAGSAAWKGNCH